MPENIVEAKQAPRPAGPYSAAVWAGDFLFPSGRVPLEPSSMKLVEGGFADAELGMSDVVITTVYLQAERPFSGFDGLKDPASCCIV